MPKQITEQTARLREQTGSRWSVTIITPGRGSSGLYTEEILARDAGTAFPKGTKLWWKHPEEGQGAGDRDPRDQWGYLTEDARWDTEAGSVIGDVQVLEHWRPVVNSLGTQADLSIYAWAEFDESDTVTALLGHVTNSVDIVSYPGRPGSGLDRKIEAAREAAPKPGVTSASQEREGEDMDEKAVEALVTRLLESALAPIVAFVNESKSAKEAEAQAKVDAEALDAAATEAVSAFEKSVEAIEAAELLKPTAEGLRARAAKGEDITSAIEAAKAADEAYLAAAKERLAESHDDEDDIVHGRIREGAAKTAAEALPKGW